MTTTDQSEIQRRMQFVSDRDAWIEANQPERPACPPWCADRTAHHQEYEGLIADGSVCVRHHSVDVGSVAVCQEEQNQDGVVTLLKPHILAFSDYGDAFDAAQARAMARDLIAAADMLDSLT